MFGTFTGEEFFDAFHLVARKELRVVFVQAKLAGYCGCHLLAVACEHHAAAHSRGVKVADGLLGVVFYGVGDHDMASVSGIDQHVENRSCDFAIGRCEACFCKHFCVAHYDLFAVDGCEDAMAGVIAGIRDALGVQFARVGGADRLRDGVIGEGFRKGRHFE
ncbi:unknown [Collinsella sp. CAG:289]|nr:unknown [Collinsella sp. CAG:289]